jgi:hypothetical protein
MAAAAAPGLSISKVSVISSVSAPASQPVRAHAQRPEAHAFEGGQLAHRRRQHPLPDRHDQARLLRQWHEVGRQHQAPAFRLPPQQRLEADDTAAGKVHLGLVIQHEFLALQGALQSCFDQQMLLGVRAHVRRVEIEIIAAIRL